MKRIISCLLIVCMLFALGACSGKKDTDPTATHTHENTEASSTTLEQNTEVFNDSTESTTESTIVDTAEGSTKQTNSTSGNKVTTTTAPVQSHKHNWKAATCTAAKTCTSCKKTEGSALGHKWQAATCTTVKTCSVCKKTEGSALGHKWKAATCTVAKTCEICKTTEGSALGHNYTSKVTKEATCTEKGTKTYTCTRCSHSYTESIAANGHKWEAATCTKAKTCKVCKATEGRALGHKWEAATCTKAKTCSRCNKIDGKALGHNYTSKVTTEATCTKTGVRTFTCSRCSDSYTKSIAASGHVFGAATCEEAAKCIKCNATNGSPAPHNWLPATCKRPKKCADCGRTEGGLGDHEWVETNAGASKLCKICGKTETIAVVHIDD